MCIYCSNRHLSFTTFSLLSPLFSSLVPSCSVLGFLLCLGKMDSDLIARVYPSTDELSRIDSSSYATQTITSNSGCQPPLRSVPGQRAQFSNDRESTPAMDHHPTTDKDKLDMLPFLELRFSKLPRAPGGVVFGTDGRISDVQLPNVRRASRRQFAITFKKFPDGRYRLIAHDLGSTFGTEVSYNGEIDKSQERKKFRRSFDWILSGSEYPARERTVIQIQVNDHLTFRIVPVHHDVNSPTYMRNVERFMRGTATSDALLGALQLHSGLQAVAASTAQTPSTEPILLPMDPKTSNGSFGLVTRV